MKLMIAFIRGCMASIRWFLRCLDDEDTQYRQAFLSSMSPLSAEAVRRHEEDLHPHPSH